MRCGSCSIPAISTALGLLALGVGAAFAAPPGGIQFNRDIRPILAQNCFPCHGPDNAARKANLRLDRRDIALESEAIVPGKPADSQLIARVFSADANLVMPPPASKKTLTLEQQELLRTWIEAGAEYQAHWSLVPVPREVRIPAPEDAAHWVRGPIDAFVLDRLRQVAAAPAPETSRERWLRRASFDLTGLPPTLAELDAFLADQQPDAYERQVDRLLQAPEFGERMASDWLDVARYADTFGYQTDREMHVWPWRDWVIRAFNQDLPYDQFILWQTAGDLLPNPTRDQRLATTFNRLHRQTNEGGSIEAEFRVAYVADRVTTNATAFLGLTLECARCHEHKFDPITQQDFYHLAAFFANIDEHGLYSHFTETAPTPTLLLYEQDQEARHAELLAKIREQELELQRLRDEAHARFAAHGPLAPAEAPPTNRYSFEDLTPAAGYRPCEGQAGQGIDFDGDDAYVCQGAGQFSRVTPCSFALWIKPAEQKPRMMLLHQSMAAEDAAFRGLSLALDDGHVAFSLIHFWPGNALAVRTRETVPLADWTHLAVTYDGGSHAAGVRVYLNGKQQELEVVRDGLSRDSQYRSEWGDSNAGQVPLSLGARFRDVGFRHGAIDELLVFDRALTAVEVAGICGLQVETNAQTLFEHYLERADAPYQAARDRYLELRREENELVTQVRQIMTMTELPSPRPTFVLYRGDYTAPKEQVAADTPSSILALDPNLPRNRLGLAQWYVDDRNPLVSRVAVNRLWTIFFGRGLVATPEDFGTQGEPPSHPELLDWLARRFMRGGWNVKQLCREIVLSATYRQSSLPTDSRWAAQDPENRLLAHGPRHRYSAEQLRDNALAVSGLLARHLGGPSVMPYQPAGLWEEAGTGKSYQEGHGEDLHRRSLYTFWRRTLAPPNMLTFDAGSREVCAVRRERTATPLQALVLWNDPQFVEAARVLAERLLHDQPESAAMRQQSAFRLLTSRVPSDKEQEILSRLYQEQCVVYQAQPEDALALISIGEAPRDGNLNAAEHAALTALVLTLLSHDECVTRR